MNPRKGCPSCKGLQMVPVKVGNTFEYMTCPICQGKGYTYEDPEAVNKSANFKYEIQPTENGFILKSNFDMWAKPLDSPDENKE